MDKIRHVTVPANGINLHVAESGAPGSPAVVLLHGFPELWYSWRHQLIALSAAGYRPIAPDLRGFGGSDAPLSPAAYTAFHVVGDLVAMLDYLGIEQVFLVGHDWGAVVAWQFALFRPDRVKALVNLSVPFTPRNPKMKPLQGMKMAFGEDFYICRFQEPGEMEEEFAKVETSKLIAKFLTSHDPKPPRFPKGWCERAAEAPVTLPPWLTEADINHFAENFKKTGFTGGLNYYRVMDSNWELTAPWTGAQIKVPTKFIMGDEDVVYNFPNVKDYLNNGGFKRDVPLLDDIVIMKGAGHFINQEKPEEITNHILDFIGKF